ncbi:MAG: phenylalanine--tRNA ligase subunit alpha [Firmicutes bacterium]|nr:phenylalanine--tRNA ligase subunit alpha [Bacillota bacterium]
MDQTLMAVEQAALTKLEAIDSLARLEAWRVEFLGKKGELAQILRGLGQLDDAERRRVGALANRLRDGLLQRHDERREQLAAAEALAREADQAVDITLPGRARWVGAEHPLRRVIRRMEDIFIGLGFVVEEGPLVELDYYNFLALNFPKDHPARDMQDTFYLGPELLLRTHTSPVQARTLERVHPHVPVRIIVPGRVYRRDEDDASHSHEFTQIEGLAVDVGIRMSDLKGVLLAFARELFGQEQQVRLRPSYFPFTEPSAELDVRCVHCRGHGCATCKRTGWMEILGCGMVHPNVLATGGYDPQEVTGFAFGMGVERIASLLYGVSDIRQFYTNDARFLEQFSGLTD